MAVIMQEKDELIMRLVHYFVTEKNYNPIVVNGVKNEIWLENHDAPYRIIRINANYIHNEEQLSYDTVKIRNIVSQVKKKTLSLKMNVLNILLDVNDSLKIEEPKNIKEIVIQDSDVASSLLTKEFPDINDKLMKEDGLDLMIDVTNDINKKTEKDNKLYESIFKPKKIVLTNILIIVNIVVFLITLLLTKGNLSPANLYNLGGVYKEAVKEGEIYRLIAGAFLHSDAIHLLTNMYSLYIIGRSLENLVGKRKFALIYFVSILGSSLLSCTLQSPGVVSVGASGAIFGLMGSMVYFGFRYRTYLTTFLKNQLIPIILLNLFVGFAITGIDNFAHIGGLIAGVLVSIGLGVQRKENLSEKINGTIVTILYLGFLTYMVFR